MFKKKGVLQNFIKILINNIFFFAITNALIIIFYSMFNRYLHKSYQIDYNIISIKYLLLLSLMFSIMSLGSAKNVTKAIRIDERAADEDRIIVSMEKLKWKLKDKGEDFFVFISPLNLGIIRDEILVKFIETEIFITGSQRYVEDIIKLAKFPYSSIEIIKEPGGLI